MRCNAQRRALVLTLLVLVELGSAAGPVLPRVDSTQFTTASSFARTAARLGPVYERAGKDIDAVRRRLYGKYPADEARWLGLAQARQAWAGIGSLHAVRYAFQHDPDGSYAERLDHVSGLLDARSWAERLKWLRAAGVRSVIAFDPRHFGDGYRVVAEDAGLGIPAYLFEIQRPLPAVRRSTKVVVANDRIEAAVRFEDPSCDPERCTVIEGASQSSGFDRPDPTALATVLAEAPDALTIETSGQAPALLFVGLAYRSGIRITVNGKVSQAYPANLCMIGIPVPAGRSVMTASL